MFTQGVKRKSWLVQDCYPSRPDYSLPPVIATIVSHGDPHSLHPTNIHFFLGYYSIINFQLSGLPLAGKEYQTLPIGSVTPVPFFSPWPLLWSAFLLYANFSAK